MFHKKLKFKVLVSHRSGAVAASEGPNDATEHMVRLVCDVLETGFWSVSSSVNLQNAVVFKTIPRNTPKYSYSSL